MPISKSNARNHANAESHDNGKGSTNGHVSGQTEAADNINAPASSGMGALIAEAQALRDFLHDGYSRASRLCVALKRHRKQSKLVASTLASLKQLQQIDG